MMFLESHVLIILAIFSPCAILAHPQPVPTGSSTAVAAPSSPAPPPNPDLNKYFHEPGSHKGGEDDQLGHHDSRFFHRVVAADERAETLHHMTRAYLTNFRNLGLETWIAHGTLLGWWWNGQVAAYDHHLSTHLLTRYQIFPWDWDVDTQVSGATLEILGDNYNRTNYTYVSEDKKFHREYLLDVNPWSRQRVRGDGANIIDARWIDTKNGLYIDITGLSELDPEQRPGVWSCKNHHDYHIRELYPMRESIFEGVPAQIPYAYHQMLAEEYKSQALINTTHYGYGTLMSHYVYCH